MHYQLPLSIGLKDSATFASFVPGQNAEVVSYLQRLIGRRGEAGLYLWGDTGVGKSHLLQAICHAAAARNAGAVYLPLACAEQFSCDALDGLEQIDMVCIDDIHTIVGKRDWEMALIDLFERIHDRGGGLVVTADTAVAGLDLLFPQLASRLAWGLQFQLTPLEPEDILQALQLRAKRRGLNLPIATARYLLRRHGGNLNALFSVLDSLDKASLIAKRKLTIPFARSVLKK